MLRRHAHAPDQAAEDSDRMLFQVAFADIIAEGNRVAGEGLDHQ